MSEEEYYQDALRQLAEQVRNDHCLHLLRTTTNSKLILALLENYIRDSFEIVPFLDAKCNRLDNLITRYFLYKKSQLLNFDEHDDIITFFMLLSKSNPELTEFAQQVATEYCNFNKNENEN